MGSFYRSQHELVLVFKVSQDDVRLLLYPVLLLFVAVAMMVGLAVSRRLRSDAGAE